jgi:hypothetical protein
MAGVYFYLRRITGRNDSQRSDVVFVAIDKASAAQRTVLFDIFRKNRMWLCPTLNAQPGDPSGPGDPRLKYFDRGAKDTWAQFKFADPAVAQQRYKAAEGWVGSMHKAGVGLLAGTDAVAGTTPYSLPGFGVHDELRRFVRAGLSPMDALRSATQKPAEYLGLIPSIGTVQKDKLAELLLLDANPLDNIDNIAKINMVITGGRVYRRSALDAILSAVEANVRI